MCVDSQEMCVDSRILNDWVREMCVDSREMCAGIDVIHDQVHEMCVDSREMIVGSEKSKYLLKCIRNDPIRINAKYR